ncbi:hypothetical protein L3Q72_18505 [Vibrio sp. JC009]|uniref:hypothetical protein n=1 Tax=Vibrio sp. JC009 TaxID=2912314 RepID=UPI0023B0B636|nr:hypothetical protein [Vibrio sp. JC009]WED24867.1 hypothetical protein L3Q72_18505 [Vibrio sp. JC009]
MLKTIFRVCVALFISFLLTVVCVAFVPTFFTSTLTTTFDLLPAHKFLDHSIQTKEELFKDLQLTEVTNTDESDFLQLRKDLPDNRDKSVFFARMFVMHDYPQKCQYTLVGMHRTLDLAWQVTGLRCGGRQSCQEALEHQVCKEHEGPKHERHH